MRATAIVGEGSEFDVIVEDEDAPIRIEIAQTHSGDRTEVTRKIQAELSTYKDGQTEITVGVAPGSLDGLIEGDEVNVDGAWREMETFAATLDDATGKWTDVPQFGVVLDEPAKRIDRVHGAIGGLNKGTSHLTRPPLRSEQPNVRP